MTKKSIIISSVLIAITALMAILFGAVFRLRKIDVVRPENGLTAVTDQDIISASNLAYGKSIFMLDKQSAIDNIEQTYAEIKVIQIKTVSVLRVQICVRERVEMFYAEYNNTYYCLDEELKVLRQTETEPVNLIKLDNDIGLNSNTKSHDFVGKQYSSQTYDLFVAMYSNVKVDDEYVDRQEICSLLESVKFETAYALIESEQTGVEYTNLILNTRQGVTIKIANPNIDLGKKINICFATYNALQDKSAGAIVIGYDGSKVFYPAG